MEKNDRLSIEAALGAMRIVCGKDFAWLMQSFGITKEDYQLVTGSEPWLVNDRERVRRILQQLAAGTLDLIGIDRFELPAEYCAAIISVFVHPTNCMAACVVFENRRPGTDIEDDIVGGEINKRKLFSFLCKFYYDGEGSAMRHKFELAMAERVPILADVDKKERKVK